MKFEGNFSEQDIRLIYEDKYGSKPDIRVMQRYKSENGYMALIVTYGKYRLFFADKHYLRVKFVTLPTNTDIGSIESAIDIASIIAAEEL